MHSLFYSSRAPNYHTNTLSPLLLKMPSLYCLSCQHAELKLCHNNVRNVVAEYFSSMGYTVFVGEIPINALKGIRNLVSQINASVATASNIISNSQ